MSDVKNVENLPENKLTVETVKSLLCKEATDGEVRLFVEICKRTGLNPFLKEAYLVKPGSSSAYMVVSKSAYMKMTRVQKDFKFINAGIIIQNEEGKIEEREGSFYLESEKLLGGWANVQTENGDFVSKIAMHEYNTGKSTWSKMPATMIRKVAIVHAIREAYPDMANMYIEEEMTGVDTSEPEMKEPKRKPRKSKKQSKPPEEPEKIDIEDAEIVEEEDEAIEEVGNNGLPF